jgi:hypothetical protein
VASNPRSLPPKGACAVLSHGMSWQRLLPFKGSFQADSMSFPARSNALVRKGRFKCLEIVLPPLVIWPTDGFSRTPVPRPKGSGRMKVESFVSDRKQGQPEFRIAGIARRNAPPTLRGDL